MTQISVYLTPTELNELHRQAKEEELKDGTYARSLLVKALKSKALNRSTGVSS